MTGTKPFHITNHREKRRGRGWKRKSGTKHELVKAVGRNFILICFATREYHFGKQNDCVQIAILKHFRNTKKESCMI